MDNFLIFGGGMMGEAICFDLIQQDISNVTIIERSEQRIDELKSKFTKNLDKISFHSLSLGKDDDKIKELLHPVTVAFGAIDYRFNLKLTKMCIETNTHFLDLGGNPDVVDQQYELSEEAKSNQVSIIPDCGLAPGMVNVIAGGLISQFDTVEECHLRVGGLPQVPEGILKYQQVFSIRGLTNEYKEDAYVIRDGKVIKIPSMTELETIYFPEPFGRLEAFQTAGGTSSLPRLFEGKIKHLTYKTIRYPGHMQFFRFLLDFDLLSDETTEKGVTPREIVEQKLVEHLPRDQADVVLIRVFVSGTKDNQKLSEVWQCIDYADTSNDISAMGRTTAYPIAIIGKMIADGIISNRGVIPGEINVPLEIFVEELEKRNITFEKSINEIN